MLQLQLHANALLAAKCYGFPAVLAPSMQFLGAFAQSLRCTQTD